MAVPSNRSRRALVTGASVAGPALAWGLARTGWQVTLLERSDRPRSAGQNIDVRGIGREVLRRMGVHDRVMENLTGEEGTRYVDERGAAYATFPRREGQDGPTAEVEILRGRFAEILAEALPSDVEQRFGDFVRDVDQDEDGIDVRFETGDQERFDLLFVAEGRSSRTRRLLMAAETQLRDFGVSIAYGTIERGPEDVDTWDWYTARRGRVASIRPDNQGTMRASLSFESEPSGFESLDVEAQLHVLRARFAGAGWQTERVLAGFTSRPEEFYTQRMEQVVVSSWSKGRVVLVGDAAWGSGPTGMGTTLALVGAHVVAGELAATPEDHQRAFARYEELMRGYADSAQRLPRGGARLLHPTTASGLRALRAAHRLAASRPFRSLYVSRLLTSERHVPDLPDYPRLRT
ncbi:FAD-dependent monooxygenase [Phycicoccus sp. CSK15P-2]|uniref:FAD-dependent monooxygenase n=1 Tax=Phycicoccus sp. CSK15P-2 TaxID=2807627 RepID=UPI001950E7C5|nr:FAD-dependent monooxygenase [Phycicoccus sp. CSK15P-2]MBM6405776.1 FAD-dependent monooxygenase [Phycicoccus sp. CSK15P-2]